MSASAPQNFHLSNSINEQFNSWVQKAFAYEKSHLIADHPWSTVVRLQGKEQAAYLKMLPLKAQDVIDKITAIHQYYPLVIPSIVASDVKHQAVIIKEYPSIPLGLNCSGDQLQRLLTTYATLQSDAVTKCSDLKPFVPHITLNSLVQDVLDFLNPEVIAAEGVGADYFMDDKREAYGYFVALSGRKAVLDDFLSMAEELPTTLNHCDLHTDNVSEQVDGSLLIYDWDDATLGPAGMSLHRPFKNASTIAKLLRFTWALEEETQRFEPLLTAYCSTLVKHNYCSAEMLQQALPAAACAGSLFSLLYYAHYPKDDFDYKKDISGIIRERIEDIVHLCDLLALENRNDTLYFTDNYIQNDAPWRGIYLLQEYALRHPNDSDMHWRLALLEMECERWQCASHTLKQLVELNPMDVRAHRDLGIALLKNGQAEEALGALETAAELDPYFPDTQLFITKAAEIIHWTNRATIPHLAPMLSLTDTEMRNNTVSVEKVNLSTKLFRQYGTVVVKNAFPRDLIEKISAIVFEKYDGYFEDRAYEDNLVLGDKRRMVTLALEGELNSPRLYGRGVIKGVGNTSFMQHVNFSNNSPTPHSL